MAVEGCNHYRWTGEHSQECHRVLQGCHSCPSMEEWKAPQDPLAPQYHTHILAALANCLNLLSEAGCTLLRSPLEAAAPIAELELYRYFRNKKSVFECTFCYSPDSLLGQKAHCPLQAMPYRQQHSVYVVLRPWRGPAHMLSPSRRCQQISMCTSWLGSRVSGWKDQEDLTNTDKTGKENMKWGYKKIKSESHSVVNVSIFI